MATLLSALTKKSTGQFQWKSEAQEVLKELKCHLSMAAVLQLPDPELVVAACQVCAHNKELWTRTIALLCPLPIPLPAWTNLPLDFVVVDQFSKAYTFVALPKFLLVKETARLLLQHVGLLSHMVLD